MTASRDEGRPAPDIAEVFRLLESYSNEHALAEVGVFRRLDDRISVRIIDPDFRGMSRQRRNDGVWDVLNAGPRQLLEKVSVLLLMTPEEAADAHTSAAEFESPTSSGPVPFLKDTLVFRERIDGHDVYVTVSRPVLADLRQADGYDAAVKVDYPPGIIAAADYGLSVDTGELLRDANYAPRWFDAPEAAKAAGIEAARRRFSRLAAA